MASPGIEIRTRVRRSDRDAIERVVRSAGNFKGHEIDVALHVLDDYLADQARSGYHFALAEVEGAVAGFVCFGRIPCTEGSSDIYWLVVDPRWQRLGIGTILLAEAEVESSKERQIYVETSSREDYAAARSFYTSSGYVLAATLADFYARGDDKLIYVKILSGPDEHAARQTPG
jgi:ribosomal protein S18 acetylase RimI-like enzyme